MKIYANVQQGTDEWRALRLGRPTASEFHRIVTTKKCELSKQAHDYALKLCAERLLNMTASESFDGMWMERGKELEPLAVTQYEFQLEVETFPVGFITTDDGLVGCSPDRLVLNNFKHAVEIKCPAQHVHLGYLLDGTTDDYKPQVQGQILVAELDRADLYSYHPSMPAALIPTTRDDAYCEKLQAALDGFNELLHDMFERAQKLGVYQPAKRSVGKIEAQEAVDIARHFYRESQSRFLREGFNA